MRLGFVMQIEKLKTLCAECKSKKCPVETKSVIVYAGQKCKNFKK
jgi:hypothetical protein